MTSTATQPDIVVVYEHAQRTPNSRTPLLLELFSRADQRGGGRKRLTAAAVFVIVLLATATSAGGTTGGAARAIDEREVWVSAQDASALKIMMHAGGVETLPLQPTQKPHSISFSPRGTERFALRVRR